MAAVVQLTESENNVFKSWNSRGEVGQTESWDTCPQTKGDVDLEGDRQRTRMLKRHESSSPRVGQTAEKGFTPGNTCKIDKRMWEKKGLDEDE
ncbi:hypothetical protein Q8A67_024502 [Cirrhinus molitorella]|uniref:Uncharacterized protein n=1 Tax=Cirrhinus molitorella TaxID=172907 RepID=A0AA88TK84_9TELE|nr:hypothetical protein Q8A67_024502 [Cirrhinus molitorella]